MNTLQLVLVTLISLVLIGFSRRQLINPQAHGFYRFFAFEAIASLFVYALPYLHHHMLSPINIASSMLLLISLGCVLRSVLILTRTGGHTQRDCPENFAFENTAHLVVSDIYSYIRHPMYTSLLLLAWGLALRNLDTWSLIAATIASLALYLTAKAEEQENRSFFGEAYDRYQQSTKMLIPFVF